MHWLLIAAVAIGAGFLYPLISGKLTQYVPAFASSNPVGQAFFTGAFILVALFVAIFALKIVTKKRVALPA